MLNGLKNAAINATLKHLLDNNKVNESSNLLAIIVTAVLANHIDWMRAAQGTHFQDPAAVAELARASGCVLVAALAFAAGKCPGLAKWFNLAGQVAEEVQKEEAPQTSHA